MPLALGLGHTGRGGGFTVALTNVSRAIPTLALLTIFAATAIGFGNRATIVALAVFAIPPLLTNTYVGIREVDPDVVEAARGMGLSGAAVLLRVELPLAVPLIAAGVRTAAVQVVATAGLAALVGGGGLGVIINDGFGQQDRPQILAGGLLVAGLALVVEALLALVQHRVTPGRDAAGCSGVVVPRRTRSATAAVPPGTRPRTRSAPSPFRDPRQVAVVTPPCWSGARSRGSGPRPARHACRPGPGGTGHRRRAYHGLRTLRTARHRRPAAAHAHARRRAARAAQSGTKAAPTKSDSAAAGGQACEAKAGDALVALEDDKKLQTVDNIIPAVNAKAATQPLLDALNKVSAALTQDKLVALNKATDIDRTTSPNAAKDFVAAEGLADGLSGGSGKIVVGAANFSENQTLANIYAQVLNAAGFDASVKTVRQPRGLRAGAREGSSSRSSRSTSAR